MLPGALLELLEGAELELLDISDEELDTSEELEASSEELDISDELASSEELATSDELASDEKTTSSEEELFSSLPVLIATLEKNSLDRAALEDATTELLIADELSTVELTRLEEAFDDDFTMAFEELPVETGGLELLPPPQALSTTVSEKAVKALNVYKLKFSMMHLCCVEPYIPVGEIIVSF